MILVSGSSGFIGQRIMKYFNHPVSIPRYKYIEQYKEFFSHLYSKVIIHFAAYGNHYYQDDLNEMVQANILNTYNILEALKGTYYEKFYNISTSSVTLKKQTYYSITKFCGEQLAGMYKNVVNIRPYSVYGEGEASHRFIPTIISHLKSGELMQLDENACHDWIYVDDFIEAMFSGYTEIGTGIKTTNLEVVKMLEEISGLKLNYKPERLREYDNEDWVSPSGVPFKTSLFNGLKRVYESN